MLIARRLGPSRVRRTGGLARDRVELRSWQPFRCVLGEPVVDVAGNR